MPPGRANAGFGARAPIGYDVDMIRQNTNPCVAEYLRLRDQIDRRVEGLVETHAEHITCTPGCCECCVNFTVFAVEFEAIVQGLQAQQAGIAFDEGASCGFLRDGKCTIYAHRPIICRTHGLPIAFYDEQTAGHSVSFCPRNFTEADLDDYAFGPDNTLDLDGLNEQLSRLNARFIRELGDTSLRETGRVDLRRLADALADPRG
jgi:Fe-S-cluster containining protein